MPNGGMVEVKSAQTPISLEYGKPYQERNLAIFSVAPNYDVLVDPDQFSHLRDFSGVGNISKQFQIVLHGSFNYHYPKFKEGATQIFPGQQYVKIRIGLDTLSGLYKVDRLPKEEKTRLFEDAAYMEGFNHSLQVDLNYTIARKLTQAALMAKKISQGASEDEAYQEAEAPAKDVVAVFRAQILSGQIKPAVVIKLNDDPSRYGTVE